MPCLCTCEPARCTWMPLPAVWAQLVQSQAAHLGHPGEASWCLQLVTFNFLGGGGSAWPAALGAASAAALVALKRVGRLHPEAAGFWDRNGTSLAATCVFMLEGLADVVRPLGPPV